MSGEAGWHDWKIVKKLGEGGFGTVYEIVRNRYSIEEHRALKVIRIPADDSDVKEVKAEGMSDSDTKAYYRSLVNEFIKEIAFLSELRGCAHIVTYDDYKVVEKKDGYGWEIFIMMELLTPLPDLLEQKPLDEKEIRKLGEHICDALSVCHGKNILHRDIKADNIFVSDDGTYKLGDFGIARTVEKTQAAHTRIGTNTYMSPEAYRGQNYDARADLYSLGILLYRLLNDNRIPFLPAYPAPITVQDRDDALTRRFAGEPLPRPAHGSDALAQIVLKACAFRAQDRFASAEEMKATLGGAPILPSQPPSRPRRAEETILADAVDGGYPAQRQPSAPPRYPTPAPPAPRYVSPPPQPRPRQVYDNAQPEKSSSGINAGVAIVIVLIVLVLIGGGVTIFALLNRNAVDNIKVEEDVSVTEAVTEAPTEPPTEAPEIKTIAVSVTFPENNTAPLEMKMYINGEEREDTQKTITNQKEGTFSVPVTEDTSFKITLDGSDYYGCTLDYRSGTAINEIYYDTFYSPNVSY